MSDKVDLSLTGSADPSDKDYYLIKVYPSLKINSSYVAKFQWVFEDQTLNDKVAKIWSNGYDFVTSAEVALNPPQFVSGDLSSDGATLVIKWSGLDSSGNAYPINLDRVDIYIRGGIYGGSYVKSADSFKAAGTKVISVGTGATYFVKLRAVSKSEVVSSFSAELSAITVANLTADVIGPAAPSSGTVTAGIDNSAGATIGFNAFLDISWSAVSDSTLRGYRIRFRENGTSNPYGYVDSPGTGTTLRLNGLSIGTTYAVGIASYDELNNTSSSYISLGTAVASGTPFIGKNVTTVGYFGASATGDTGTFKFGYGVQDSGGTQRGLVFNSHNYWYISSTQSALFKVGGATSNYMEWNGEELKIAGNLGVDGSTKIGGNIKLSTAGASIYNGTLDGAGALTGTGFMLNKDGLQFKVSGTPTITLDALTGAIIATNATITGNIIASTITASTIQTSSDTSSRRTALSPSTHSLSFYGPTGVGQAHITPLNDETSGLIISAGTSPVSSILDADVGFLMYKHATLGGFFTLKVSSTKYLSVSSATGISWIGTAATSDTGLVFPPLRNMNTASVTNWNSNQYPDPDGTVMLVYS